MTAKEEAGCHASASAVSWNVEAKVVEEAAAGPALPKSDTLIQRYRRNVSIIKTSHSNADLVASTLNVFKKGNDLGGEGVLYIQAAKQSRDSGYWIVTLFAIRGRAFEAGPMGIYTVYVVLLVVVMQAIPSLNDVVQRSQQTFQGLQVALSLVGTALFFLQTFRTNSAYHRWWEGRIVWGSMSHQLINVATTVSAGNIQSRLLSRRLLRWGLAFLTSLKLSLRGDSSLSELGSIMSAPELAALQRLPPPLRPTHCIARMKEALGRAIRAGLITKCASRELERSFSEITISMGAVRRIMGTPMPFAYLSHLRTFLFIWISVLPFVFMYYMSYMAIAVSIIIAYSLLGMEAISLEIEAPFGRDFNDLPIDNLTDDCVQVLLNAYEDTRTLSTDDGTDGDGELGLDWGSSSPRGQAGAPAEAGSSTGSGTAATATSAPGPAMGFAPIPAPSKGDVGAKASLEMKPERPGSRSAWQAVGEPSLAPRVMSPSCSNRVMPVRPSD